ncbi:MAG: hypothetical protein FWC68_06060 [Oscillospiraceae bacterium]|nr:hypothetical protein [Oscillospiraceae bacterium]
MNNINFWSEVRDPSYDLILQFYNESTELYLYARDPGVYTITIVSSALGTITQTVTVI